MSSTAQDILTQGGQNLETQGALDIVTQGTLPNLGTQSNILLRLQNLMPPGWFTPGEVPVRDALLTGIANALSFIQSLFSYVKQQTRIATATDGFLDIAAADFLGNKLPRGAGQQDASYRANIQAQLFLLRNTRLAIIGVLTRVTGIAPIVIEPARAADAGCYNVGTAAYNVAGCYGSLGYPFQMFVTAYLPAPGSPQYGITNADIYAAVESVRMGATIVWVRILPAP